MTEGQTCSWCHTPNDIIPFARNWCRQCGHAADRSRGDCDCAKCKAARAWAPKSGGSDPLAVGFPSDKGAPRIFDVKQLRFMDASVAFAVENDSLVIVVTDEADKQLPTRSVRVTLTESDLECWLTIIRNRRHESWGIPQ